MLRSSSTTNSFSITLSPTHPHSNIRYYCWLRRIHAGSIIGTSGLRRDAFAGGHSNRGSGPLTGFAVDKNFAVVVPHQLLDDCHPQPRTAARRVERLE